MFSPRQECVLGFVSEIGVGWGMMRGIRKAHRETPIPMATVCQVGGLEVQLPCTSLEIKKKQREEGEGEDRREQRKHFVSAHLTKQRQLTLLVSCQIF